MTAYDKMKYIIEHGNYGDEVRKLPETVWYQGCVRKFDVLAEREFPRWETDDFLHLAFRVVLTRGCRFFECRFALHPCRQGLACVSGRDRKSVV